MAKTIKELAEEYAYTNWESDDYHEGAAEGLPFDAIGYTKKTYLAGANAMLEEVEKAIDLGKYPDLISPTEALFKVTQLVIRLKG